MKMRKLIGFVAILLCIFSSLKAQTNTSNQSVQNSEVTKLFQDLSGYLSYYQAMNLKTPDSFEKNLEGTLTLRVNYKLNEDLTLQSYLAGTKEFTNQKEQHFENGFLGVNAHLLTINSWLKLSGRARTYFPFNEEIRRDTTFRSRLYLAPALQFDFSSLGAKGLTLTLRSAVSKNFHEFKRNRVTSDPNASYQVQNIASGGYKLTDQLSINAYFFNVTRWNYEGTRLGDIFEMGQDITFLLNKSFTLELGHVIGGNSFKANGVDSNIRVFDNRDSSIYAMLYYNF